MHAEMSTRWPQANARPHMHRHIDTPALAPPAHAFAHSCWQTSNKSRDKIPSPLSSNPETISPAHGLTGVSSLLSDNSRGANLQLQAAELSLCMIPAKKPFLILSSSSENTAEKPCAARPGSLGAFWTSPVTLPWVVICCHGP